MIRSLFYAGLLLGLNNLPANAEIVLKHSIQNVYQAEADAYLHSTRNVRKYSEWQRPPVTYWGTTANGVAGEIVYRFDAGVKIDGVKMFARVNPFDFGHRWGQAWIYGSKDGVTWELLVDGSARGGGTYVWGTGFGEMPKELPSTLTGGDRNMDQSRAYHIQFSQRILQHVAMGSGPRRRLWQL